MILCSNPECQTTAGCQCNVPQKMAIRSRLNSDPREVAIDYTNYRGERSLRRVLPLGIFWGANEWHPEEQWLLSAMDLEKNAARIFAVKDIHSWNSRYSPCLRDTDEGFIDECQRDRGLIKDLLRNNSELLEEHNDLRAGEAEVARLKKEVEAWRERFPVAGFDGEMIVLSG